MRKDGQNGQMTILIVTHKPYELPEAAGYRAIQVGGQPQIDAGYLRDNTGENIAEKNGTFCELTALYWAWKNLDAEILGLCHYRRYLGYRKAGKTKRERLLTEGEVRDLLGQADIILPKKRHYWIETREGQYVHAHHGEDLRCTEGVLEEKHPDFLPAWKHMLGTRSGHICNMFIARREIADEYCEWLFSVLFEVEKRLDISEYSANDKRVFGFLGERLLDVWVETKGLQIAEVPIINLDRQHWIRKGTEFLRRKFEHKEKK